MTRRVQNSDSIARLVVRELRGGNKLKECDGCGLGKYTMWFGERSLCKTCAPTEGAGNTSPHSVGICEANETKTPNIKGDTDHAG